MEAAGAAARRGGARPLGLTPPPDDVAEPSPATPTTEPMARVSTWETLAIFVAFAVAYTLLGYQIVVAQHVVVFDSLDRLTRAFMVWYNEPPKLAAVGFSYPPLQTMLLLPFAAIKGLVTSGIALPLSSGIFAGGALAFLNRMFAAADMARLARYALLAAVAINPMFAFYAINGTAEAAYMLFLTFALFCMIGWFRTDSARYLIGAGLAFAVLALTRYEFLIWALLLGTLFAAALANRNRDQDEVQGSVIAFLAPTGYALALWIFFNGVVLGDPFAWVDIVRGAPVGGGGEPGPGFSIGEALGNALEIQLIFPLTLVIAPVLLINFMSSRSYASLGLGLLIAINVIAAIVSAAVADSIDMIELRDALPAMIATLAGVAWLYYTAEDLRPVIWSVALGLSLLALPLAWQEMKTFPHQNLEAAFTRAVATGDDQEGTSSRGGFEVGVDFERQMADYIAARNPGTQEVLTDNARTYGVISLSGEPAAFFDRVDKGDTEWQRVLADPVGKVDFMLVERSGSDLVSEQYPGAGDGDVPFLEPVVSNDRYTLLRVVPEPAVDTSLSPQTPGGGAQAAP